MPTGAVGFLPSSWASSSGSEREGVQGEKAAFRDRYSDPCGSPPAQSPLPVGKTRPQQEESLLSSGNHFPQRFPASVKKASSCCESGGRQGPHILHAGLSPPPPNTTPGFRQTGVCVIPKVTPQGSGTGKGNVERSCRQIEEGQTGLEGRTSPALQRGRIPTQA